MTADLHLKVASLKLNPKPSINLCSIRYCPLFFLVIFFSCTPKERIPNSKVDTKGGYKTLKLNASFNELKFASFHETLYDQCEGKKHIEIKDSPFVNIGAITFDKVELRFCRDTLGQIILYKPFDSNEFETLIKIYSSEFGKPSDVEDKEDVKSVAWLGNDISIRAVGSSKLPNMWISYDSHIGNERAINEAHKCEERKLEKGKADL